jgi:tRNA threonylcarbamoyladenosine biosynthesis protein TsaE
VDTFHINNLSELPTIAKAIIDLSKEQKIIAFYGAMGAGKTTLIKEIAKQLGVTGVTSSPTFSLINEYHSADGTIIYHFDFYRIKNIDEAYDIGYEDYFYSNHYCFIEWPEKIEELLPSDTIKVSIKLNREERIIEIK